MTQKSRLVIWMEYQLSKFSSSVDRSITVQEAISSKKLELIPGLKKMTATERKNLLMDIRGAARDYYFKGKVPAYYQPVLTKYRRSVLYHLLHHRNYD